MDRTHEASSIEILIEVFEELLDPRDALIHAIDIIKDLKEELASQCSANTIVSAENKNLRTEVGDLKSKMDKVYKIYPNFDMDVYLLNVE